MRILLQSLTNLREEMCVLRARRGNEVSAHKCKVLDDALSSMKSACTALTYAATALLYISTVKEECLYNIVVTQGRSCPKEL